MALDEFLAALPVATDGFAVYQHPSSSLQTADSICGVEHAYPSEARPAGGGLNV